MEEEDDFTLSSGREKHSSVAKKRFRRKVAFNILIHLVFVLVQLWHLSRLKSVLFTPSTPKVDS